MCCQFCKLQEQETLKDLYNQDDDHQELANYYVTASYREKVTTTLPVGLLSLWCGLSNQTKTTIWLPVSLTACLSLCVQRLESRLSLLQSAVDEYNKAKNEFAAKVKLTLLIFYIKTIKCI